MMPSAPQTYKDTGKEMRVFNSPDTTGKSPLAMASPSMQLIRQRFRQDLSNLLLQGQLKELFIKCSEEDRIVLTDYMHEFWIHTFVTAKYWGRGPLLWTIDMIIELTLSPSVIPSSAATTPAICFAPSPLPPHDEAAFLPTPSQHCRWVIHVTHQQQYASKEEDKMTTKSSHPLEEPWSLAERNNHSFPQSIQQSITESTFTSLSPEHLPVSNSLIAESLRTVPSSLQLESLRFAIMAGNIESSLKEVYPYHLAASYLDGGNTCCSLLTTLLECIEDVYPVAKNYEDIMGHTVLDSLTISIIRSHTRVRPREVSSNFIDTDAYPGEERDACGRWDVDFPAIRRLFQRGKYRVPFNWKHPFCHSSVQAVCHNMMRIFSPGDYIPHINRFSGLFIRHCVSCGTKLSLGTLHLIVVLAYHLANSGVQGETLFGAMAMLVCLLRLGANVSLQAEVSFDEILGLTSATRCHHAKLDADGFMQTVPAATVDGWSPECQIGWHCMRGILQLAKSGKIHRPSTITSAQSDSGDPFDSMVIDGDDVSTVHGSTASCQLVLTYHQYSSFPCGNPQLGLIWAAIQAEMLTYRKIEDLDSWISDNFSMGALKKWLRGESVELEMPFVQRDMLQAHTICGCNYEGSVNLYSVPFMPFVTMSKWGREMLDISLATLPDFLIPLLANDIQKPHSLSSGLILRTWLPVSPDSLAVSIDTDLSTAPFELNTTRDFLSQAYIPM
ncbi:hypothetical protein M431DRAFT_547714 [Trichoderma harzianum CBS 226.95]|uniref:Uncharacterized protein n=1 Tax=Trichoderma harzianum CBS 226.95 TaxID=983964 RepID=A0A2T4AK39_TRIHA|nr:hypothetical protein M431DRAFT_547714 [Trichoderma harzianum CBS 226.95]PTB57423.1 hypothetical protein M431DRAFT_547714 [Trichoderma harzianum CBS 226.95]